MQAAINAINEFAKLKLHSKAWDWKLRLSENTALIKRRLLNLAEDGIKAKLTRITDKMERYDRIHVSAEVKEKASGCT